METLITNFANAIDSAPLYAMLLAFVGGILASLTPCVYPLIPLTVGFLGLNRNRSRSATLLSAVSYSLGLSLTYSLLGLFAALTGTLFGSIASNPWVYLVVGNICIISAISMFGAFEIKIPQFISAKLGGMKHSGGIPGAFFFGAVSALVASPCTAPVLASLLAFVSTKQSPLYGMGLMFSFSLGLSFLLFILGFSTSLLASMPKSGAWMNRVKVVFGIILLLAGEYFIVKAGELWL